MKRGEQKGENKESGKTEKFLKKEAMKLAIVYCMTLIILHVTIYLWQGGELKREQTVLPSWRIFSDEIRGLEKRELRRTLINFQVKHFFYTVLAKPISFPLYYFSLKRLSTSMVKSPSYLQKTLPAIQH